MQCLFRFVLWVSKFWVLLPFLFGAIVHLWISACGFLTVSIVKWPISKWTPSYYSVPGWTMTQVSCPCWATDPCPLGFPSNTPHKHTIPPWLWLCTLGPFLCSYCCQYPKCLHTFQSSTLDFIEWNCFSSFLIFILSGLTKCFYLYIDIIFT